MKILFVLADLFLSEPMGLMQLSSICRGAAGRHTTKLVTLRRHSLARTLNEYAPDVVAYSAMTPDADLFVKADAIARSYSKTRNNPVIRIMGGPHPTYFPEILDECKLDAVCIGEGDNAILRVLDSIRDRKDLSGIPNILCAANKGAVRKELIEDLDVLPFADREIIHEAVPYYKTAGLRSFLTSRGCPYNCSYCHNHAYNEMFRGCGPILRRRSVAGVMEEIKHVIKKHPPVRMVRFADDTFAHRIDKWVVEFLEAYRNQVGLPFYCLMRSNTLTEDMARLLSGAGCKSIGMAVETGDENVRNNILRRNLTDEVVTRSFEAARKYRLNTFGNTMLGIPGTTIQQDYESIVFAKKLKLSVPTFGILCPYPRTGITEFAMKKGLLPRDFKFDAKYGSESALNCYTKKEKRIQLRLSYLGSIFCSLPDCFLPVMRALSRLRLTKLYAVVGTVFVIFRTSTRIFPCVYPRNPIMILKLLADSVRFNIAQRWERDVA